MDNIFEPKKPKAKKEKQIDFFNNMIFETTLTKGFKKLNVLAIGDDLKGLAPVVMSDANYYFFTDVERQRHRWRPIDRLAEYNKLLDGKFDVVISREYNESYMEFCRHSGLYMSQILDHSQMIKGIYDAGSKCMVISRGMSGKNILDRAPFLHALTSDIANIAAHKHSDSEVVYVPDIDRALDLKAGGKDEVLMTAKGYKTSPYTAGLLDVLNKSLSMYNPLFTTYTGIVDAFHRFPSTAFVSFKDRIANMKELGFKVDVAPTAETEAERLKKKYDFLTTPVMPLLPQQTLAYIKEGKLKAKDTVLRLGVEKGKQYPVRVGWQKRRDGKLKRGFMTVMVNGFTLWEDSQEDIQDFIAAFGLPKIESMEDAYPAILSNWHKQVQRMFPRFKNWQVDDVALAATKPFCLIGHDKSLGKTVMSAAWAKIRGYRRVLVAAQGQYLKKWADELKKWGFKYVPLDNWKAVDELREQIRSKVKNTETVFYLAPFEFLGLESNLRMDPWTCVEKDQDGYLEGVIKGITTHKCPSCGKTANQARTVCPNCGESERYTGRYCHACKTSSYTFKREKPLTPVKCAEIERLEHLGRNDFSSGVYPAYRKLKKLFSCVIIDEAQDVKNKNTLRSTAVRSLHAKGRALATATLMKNYPFDIFWPVSYLLGFNNPLFPYHYKGGFPFFERQFGTDLLLGHTSQETEKWQKLPEVSNITIMWKLMAPFMVRRLKTDIGAKDPEIEIVPFKMSEEHRDLYLAVRESRLNDLSRELLKENPDARVLGANLWGLRAASTIPVASRYFPQIKTQFTGSWGKLDWIVEKMKELQSKGEKALIFTTMVDMADHIKIALDSVGITALRIKQSTKNRFEVIKRFNADTTTVAVSTLTLINKCYDIESVRHVIFTDSDWLDEPHNQALGRAGRALLTNHTVKGYYLLNEGTIDFHMYELAFQKGEAIANVMDRRAVYQPADVLREAVEAIQVRVAKRILSERPDQIATATAVKTVVTSKPAPATTNVIVWPDFKAVGKAEQLGLFGIAA